ncbi:MAG TPA: hypothetical protein VHG32_20090, partial [Thermoanaerobaculia bacterium]|nr:hypothetical protein [Thermoanaerobaculia bacterium]
RTRPWRRSWLVRGFLAGVLDASTDLPSSWEAARERVLPAVRHRSYVEACRLSELAEGGEPKGPAFEPVAGGIVKLLAYDAPTFMALPTATTQQAWGVSLGEALAQPVLNLERVSEPRWSSPARGVYVSGWQDDYDGSRILSERALRGLTVEGAMVALIPDRNCFVVTGLGDVEALRTALEFAAGRANPRPVSMIPLVRSCPGWETLELAPSHPCYALWRRLVLEEKAQLYGQQKKELEALFARLGRDVFVASFMVTEEPGGHLWSRCTWTAGAVSLLPETDLIGFVDLSRPEGQQLLGWLEGATLRGRLGKLLEATDFYPIRYQVESFPSAAEIGAIPAAAPAGEQEGAAPVEMP